MKRLVAALALGAFALAAAACSGAAPATPGTDPSSAPTAGATHVAAQDLRFVDSDVSLAAGKASEIVFENREGAPHNMTIARDESFDTKVFEGEIVSSSTVTYEVPALTAGTYVFRCDIHPDMRGTITVR